MEKGKYELWELDFTEVEKNECVRSQGIVLCIKTQNRGFFSFTLERFPSRQDLAQKKFVAVLELVEEQGRAKAKVTNKCQCSFVQSVLGDGCRYCQPQEYIDRLHDQIEEQDEELDQLQKQLAKQLEKQK